MLRVSDAQRRARLGARHLRRRGQPVDAAVARAVALHSSDPATPYLSLWARVAGFAVSDLDRALYDARTLWRLHAMRRTLFVCRRELAPVLHAAAGRAVAAAERRRVERWVEQSVTRRPPSDVVDELERGLLLALADGRPRSTSEVTRRVGELDQRVTIGTGRWATTTPLSSRLLYLLAMELAIVRARPAGTWRSSQYQWAMTDSWFGDVPPAQDADAGATALAHAYLQAFGPATFDDLRWWAGWTVRRTRRALEDVATVEVAFDDGRTGLHLADDRLDAPGPGAAVTLLPSLDHAAMAYRWKGFYVGDHRARLFDANGNAGPTVWVDGRTVGGWAQRPDGVVVVELLERGVDRDAVEAEAERLTNWLDGTVVTPRFRTPLERELSA